MIDKDKTIISCRRHFRHPVSRVYAAFLDADKVKQWFGPKEFTIGKVKIVPELGGELAIEIISPKGGVMWVRGRYIRLEENKLIEYTFVYEPDMSGLGETKVSIQFIALEAGADVVLTHTVYKSINADGRTKGWEDGFDKMELLLSVLESA